MTQNKNNTGSLRTAAVFTLATSVVDKIDYWQKMDPANVEGIKKTLEKYPDVKVIVEQLIEARTNPEATKKLAQEAKAAHGKSSAKQTEDDLTTMMMANFVLSSQNSAFLSEEVSHSIKHEPNNFRGFGGGNFGGGGSGGTFETQSHKTHDHQQQNQHDTTVHHSTPTYHDHTVHQHVDTSFTHTDFGHHH